MSASPTINTAVASTKRPLEEPSSPSGQDQPEAKRPALDKVVKEETPASVPEAATATVPVTKSETIKDEVKGEDLDVKPVAENGTSDHQVDTLVPDAPVSDTKPIESTANSRAVSTTNAPVDESQWLHMRAIISSAEAATVIGTRGENVQVIRQKSGAKCTISDYARGNVERVLTVSGPVESVAKAFGLIIRTLNQEDLDATSTAQSKTYPLRLLIPHILIGSVIGKGGARIKEIQSASSARLNASESCLPLSTERSLVVLGVADAVHIATYYIGQTLVEQLTERFGGPAASAYAMRNGTANTAPGGLQVIPYVPQNAGGQWGPPDNSRRHNAPSQRAVSNPYGAPQYHGQPAQPMTPAPVHFGAQPSPRGYQGAGPAQPPQHAHHPYGAPAGPYGAPQVPHVGPGIPSQQQPMPGAAMPGGATTQQIFIPNDMVGAIIGKGGAKINEIRQISGSVIKINEPQDNSNERLVTITGTPECNQMALYMLYTRLESEKHRI